MDEANHLRNLIFWVVLFTLFWLGVIVLPAFRMKRAIIKVIRIFRREQSFCFNNSKTLDQLGLIPPPLWDRLFRLRDFKPFAVQILIKAGVIHLSEGGMVCLQESKAAEFLVVHKITE